MSEIQRCDSIPQKNFEPIRKKQLHDGTSVIVNKWLDATGSILYRLQVENEHGESFALPFDVRRGTKEKVDSLFNRIHGTDTYQMLLLALINEDLEDK